MDPKNPKSVKMAVYNKAIAAARQGKTFKGQKLEVKRINKAFGLLQSGEVRPYHTTINNCDCPDSLNRPGYVCHHRNKLMMEVRIAQAEQHNTPSQPIDPATVLMGNGNWTAEQVSGGYYIHNWAFDFEAVEFIISHPEIAWVRPTNATGRRLHPDQNH